MCSTTEVLEYRRAGLQKCMKPDVFDDGNGTNSGTHCADVQSVPATIGIDLFIDPVRSNAIGHRFSDLRVCERVSGNIQVNGLAGERK